MGDCPGFFVAETDRELWKTIELRATVAHGEKPGERSQTQRRQVRDLIRDV
jgi:hypothetical protein